MPPLGELLLENTFFCLLESQHFKCEMLFTIIWSSLPSFQNSVLALVSLKAEPEAQASTPTLLEGAVLGS